MECQCCLEVRQLQQCPTEQCTFAMCKQCISNYNDVICPACRQIRFEVTPATVHHLRINPRCFYTMAYISLICVIIVATLFATLYNNTYESVSLMILVFLIVIMWASFLMYTALRL